MGETEDLVVDMTICKVIRSRISTASLVTHTPKLQTKQISNNHPSDSRTWRLDDAETTATRRSTRRVGPNWYPYNNFPDEFSKWRIVSIIQANHTARSERKKVTWTLVDDDGSEAEHRAGNCSGKFGS